MDLVSRAQNLILKPKDEWVKIKGETTTIPQLFMTYAVLIAAIPAIAQFIGYGLVGVSVPFLGAYRFGLVTALLRAVVFYVFQLAAAYGFGMIINILAPNFGSKQDPVNAMKLAVYSMSIAWIGGIFYIIPAIGILAILASLYALYVLYLGFMTPMMETPKEKVMTYFAVSLVVAIVLFAVASWLVTAIFAIGRVSVGM
jgi:hypothetical protein